jgi:hypothetical protein
MLPDTLLRDFAIMLGAESPGVPVDWEKQGFPSDVGRLLAAVGGSTCGDLQFFERSEVEAVRAHGDKLGADFEAGKSEVAAHALWGADWYPIARSSSEIYAYAPLGCLRGPPGQIVCFDIESGEYWEGFPSMAFWIGALKAACEGALGQNATSGARRWAAARSRLFRVDLPKPREEQRAKARFFDPPRTSPMSVDAEIERRDFTLFVLRALSFGRNPSETLGAIAHALDAEVPYCNLETLARASQDDAAALGRSWLGPLLAKHAAKKNVTQLLFGTDYRSNSFRLWIWPGEPGYTPSASERIANSTPCFGELCTVIDTPDVGFSSEAWAFVSWSAAFLIRALLDAAARSLPWEGALSVMLNQTQLGVCDTDGFVPTPVSIARTQLESARKKSVAGLRQMNFPGQSTKFVDHPLPVASEDTRRLRHPDGRAWEVVVGADSWECTIVESDGERDTFTRPIKTGWEVETLIAAQLRAGFVEA